MYLSNLLVSAGGYNRSQEFTTSGTWTRPASVNECLVVALGAGASGASGAYGDAKGFVGGAGGGGGSGYLETKIVTVSSNLTITIGSGGVVPNIGSSGNVGGNTTVTGTGVSITAGGGLGGVVGDYFQANGTSYYGYGGIGGTGGVNGSNGSNGIIVTGALTPFQYVTGGIGGNSPLNNNYGKGGHGGHGICATTGANQLMGCTAGTNGYVIIFWRE